MRDSTGAPSHALPSLRRRLRSGCEWAWRLRVARVSVVPSARPRSCHGLPAARTMGTSYDSRVRVEWIAAVTFAAGTAALGYLAYKKFYVKDNRTKAMVNLQIQKDNPKVVHAFDMEDLGDKAVYCRCWRSKKFPFCDGSHIKHNEETGDNVGPLIIKKKEA
ncbi:hypothetical protein A6R68_02865 [Neotoma lepida]|uniref:CDGSH iron-sulfur domain-containing protein 2 n=1 Tax=Neotoma lepida TaxID=56216 RepID=A0A1A6GRS4_NEOLE|nr:hypothetical protein A6R68_02865 [Neotoma lepida]